MPRLQAIDPQHATGQAKQLLSGLSEKFGMTPNLARTLANSPAALKGYLALGAALEEGELSAKLREQIAVTISEANDCNYCVAGHCAIGKANGLSDTELSDARKSSSPYSRVDAALRFARQLVDNRGAVDDIDLARIRSAGYSDAAITEIVAIVAWKTLSNYLNHVAKTEIDFPEVPVLVA